MKNLMLLITLTLSIFPGVGTAYAQEEHDHIMVDIDVKPGSFPNTINLKNKGVVPVALFGSVTLDVRQVDTATVRFGPVHHHMDSGAPAVRVNADYVNGDGYLDLVFYFRTDQTGLQPGDTRACLHGELLDMDGTHFCGEDDIRVIGY